MHASRRVAITGMGVLSPIGVGVENFWNGLLNKIPGISRASEEYAFLPCRIFGCIDEDAFKSQKEKTERHITNCGHKISWRSISRGAAFGLCAAAEALAQCGLSGSIPLSSDLNDRCGVHFGFGLEGLTEILHSGASICAGNYRGIGPHALTRSLGNIPAGLISLFWGFRGFCMANSTACASGVHSIGDAYRMIQHGEADIVLAGASEASIVPWSIAAFSRLRALSTSFNDKPNQASRPFDSDRDGFVMSEGAAAFVLQAWPPSSQIAELTGNKTRPLAEIIGYGRSADAYDLVSPHPGGDGAYRSMLAALKDAGLHNIEQLCHINCHASSTPLGDNIELAAVARLLASLRPTSGPRVVVNSIKGYTGHLMGAAGAIEAVYTALSVARGQAMPNRNLYNPPELNELAEVLMKNSTLRASDVDLALECFTTQIHLPKDDAPPIELRVGSSTGRRVSLTNSFGFGGTNGSLVIAEWKD